MAAAWFRNSKAMGVAALLSALVFAFAPPKEIALAQGPSIDDIVSGVVRVKADIDPEARTRRNLGRQREGSGIVIDSNGLVLTIGYLIVEAQGIEVTGADGRTVPAEFVGYDHETGFGLLRALAPLKARPFALGKSAELKEHSPALIASFGGRESVMAVEVVGRREFAGNWEYLISDAIFTAPPFGNWSGAALINHRGELVGVGSLIVADAPGKGEGVAGNMFVPIDALPPILGDLLSKGRVAGPGRPWLGLTTEESRGRLVVSRVVAESPAQKAGIRRGDVIVGVAGATPKDLADFYRKIWSVGDAGVTVPLDVMQGQELRHIDVRSINRLDNLKLKSTF